MSSASSLKKFILFQVSFWFSISASGQGNLVYDQLLVEDGLPTNEIYWAHQTKNGNIWFSTDHGVVRFDGIRMRIFDNSDGLPGLTVFKCFEDDKNECLWFTSYEGGVFCIRGDSVYTPDFNEELREMLGVNWVDKIHVKNDTLLMSFVEASTFYLSVDVKANTIKKIPLNAKKYGWYSFFLKDEDEIILSGNISVIDTSTSINELTSKDQNFFVQDKIIYAQKSPIYLTSWKEYYETYKEKLREKGEISYRRRTWFSEKIDNCQWLSIGKNLFQIIEDSIRLVETFDSQIINLCFTDRHLILSLDRRGLIVYDFEAFDKSLHNKRLFFSSNIVSNIYQDNRGYYWISTIGGGVFKVYSFDIRQYELSKIAQTRYGYLSPFYVQEDTLKLYSGDSLFFVDLNPNNQFRVIQSKAFNSLFEASKPNWTGWDNKGNFYLLNFVWNYHSNRLDTLKGIPFNGHRGSFSVNERLRVMINFKGYSIFRNDTLIFYSPNEEFEEIVNDVVVVNENHHFIATVHGFYEYREGIFKMWDKSNTFFNSRVQDMEIDEFGNLYLASRGEGVAILRNDSLIIFNEDSGLSSNMANKVLLSDSVIYVGTNGGLDLLIPKGDNYEVKNWLSNEVKGIGFVTDIFETSNEIVVQNDDIITLLDKSKPFFEQEELKLVLEEFTVSGSSYSFKEDSKIRLKWNQNDIDLTYSTNTLKSDRAPTLFKYRLTGLSNSWISTFNPEISFDDLEPKSYVLEVLARDAWGNWTNESSSISFEITSPWYKSNWFFITLVLIGVFLIWLYFFIRQKQLSRSRELIFSNIEALKNQMNPHFIFNSLNSIQYFIATEQKREANVFLAKLSDLVRNILDNSGRSKISLVQEISRIQDYLELESLRLNDNFNYSINVQPKLDSTSISLPPLLLQPIIENSIWHGFSSIDYQGELIINFKLEEDILEIEISDNGSGMEINKWKDNPRSGKGNSIGLNNVLKRLDLISRIKGKPHRIEFFNQQNNPTRGTVIKLYIPQ